MKKEYKVSVYFAINNHTQFIWFKNCIKILESKNRGAENIIFRVLLDSREKKLNEEIEMFINGISTLKTQTFSNTKNLFKNIRVLNHPIIWWVHFPFIAQDSEYILWIDNDTIPFINIEMAVDDILEKYNSEKHFIFQRPTNVDDTLVTKFKLKLIKAHKPKKSLSLEKLGNGGFVLIDFEKYMKALEDKGLAEYKTFIKYVRKFINRSFIKTFTTYLSDEVFYLTLFDDNIFNDIPLNFNFSQAALKEEYKKYLDESNIMFHMFVKFEGRKIPMYKYFDENTIHEEFEFEFEKFLIEQFKIFKKKYNEKEVIEFSRDVMNKMKEIKSSI